MKETPHEKMKQDEVEYAERGARAYAICCSQRELDDETELRGAFLLASGAHAPIFERPASAEPQSSTRQHQRRHPATDWFVRYLHAGPILTRAFARGRSTDALRAKMRVHAIG